MKLAFRQRKIRVRDSDTGELMELRIPVKSARESERATLLLLTWRIARFTPDQVSGLFSTPLSDKLLGPLVWRPAHMRSYPSTVEGYLSFLRDHPRGPGVARSVGSGMRPTDPT